VALGVTPAFRRKHDLCTAGYCLETLPMTSLFPPLFNLLDEFWFTQQIKHQHFLYKYNLGIDLVSQAKSSRAESKEYPGEQKKAFKLNMKSECKYMLLHF